MQALEREQMHPNDVLGTRPSRAGGGRAGAVRPDGGQAAAFSLPEAGGRLAALGGVLMLASLLIGALSHGYHLFQYPLYITDEGIYIQQAWSVLREGRLSPYTYFYDHAPAGWLFIAAWVQVLPFQFQTFGNAINTGRVLMLLAHLASVFFLFQVTWRLSASRLAAFTACFLFNLSPLAVFYQRQVLLDNLMVFWLLLGLYLATRDDRRILTPMLGGLAFGVGILTKENAVFFLPVIAYLLYSQVRGRHNRRFTLAFTAFTVAAVTSLYFLLATLKNELFPPGFNFDVNASADRVSLLGTLWWQLHRSQGSILDPNSLIWEFSLRRWLPKDAFILAAGAAAMVLNVVVGLRDRRRERGYFVAGLLAASYALYLAKGSMMLEFYVVPLLPFLAMNVGMGLVWLLRRLPLPSIGAALVVAGFFGVLVLHPGWGYVLTINDRGKVAPQDLYVVPLTGLQAEQLAFVRSHIPPDAKMIIDDDIWADLHDVRPYYRFAHSHFKASSDPDVRDKLFAKQWRNVDYVVMSNKMRVTMEQNNGDGRYGWIFEALDHHAKLIWELERGGVRLEVWQVQKS